jgi:RNA polymerase sigma-70 factor (ECF subfamily)
MDRSSQDELVARARQGDTLAFEALLAPVVEPAHRLAKGLVHDSQLAEDAVQEAAVKAWRKLSQLRSGSPFRPWFLGIVNNEARNLRRGRWWRQVRNQEPQVEVPSPDEAALTRIEIRRALLRLSEAERLVVLLRYYVDLPWEEVAAITGGTEAGARTRLYRGLAKLRPELRTPEVLT